MRATARRSYLRNDQWFAGKTIQSPILPLHIYETLQPSHGSLCDATENVGAKHKPKLTCPTHLTKHLESPWVIRPPAGRVFHGDRPRVTPYKKIELGLTVDDNDVSGHRRRNGGEDAFEET